MRAAIVALMLCAPVALAGCKEQPVAPAAEPAATAQARLARAPYGDAAELARLASELYNNRRAAAGLQRVDMTAALAAMAPAAKDAWTLDRFADAARTAPLPSPAIAAAEASLAKGVEASVTGNIADRDSVFVRKEAISEADAALTLPARFGPEVSLLLQRLIAGYAAVYDGRAARTPPAQLAAEIVRDGRAAAGVGRDAVRAGRGGPTAQLLQDLERASLGVYQARWGLGSLPPADAARLIAWNRSPEGRAHNNALLARLALANDAAGIDMLTRFFDAVRTSGAATA